MRLFFRAALIVTALGLAHSANAITVGSAMPFVYQQWFDANGDPCSSCRLFTYTAGTSTPVTVYASSEGAAQLTFPITLSSAGRPSSPIFLDPRQSYKFVLCAAGSDNPCGSPLWTIDGVQGTPLQADTLHVTGTAGESLDAGNVVYLSDGSGGLTAGRWYKADSDLTYASVTANGLGFVLTPAFSITAGSSISVLISGRDTDLSGLTAGTLYYVSATAGGLTSTPPTNARPIGVADSTTSLIVSAFLPEQSASATYGGRVNATTQSFAGVKTFEGGAPLFLASGVASNTARVSGRLTSNTSTTSVGNVGAGEDTLHTTTIPAGTLSNDGMTLRLEAWFTYANNANNKQVKCYFGAQQLIATGTLGDDADVRVMATLIRTGAATQRAVASFWLTDGAGNEVHSHDVTTPTETLANAIVLRCTGEATSNDDVQEHVSIVEVIG